MKALNTLIGIAVVAVVGYFAIKWLAATAKNQNKGKSGGSGSGGSLGNHSGPPTAADNAGFLQYFKDFIAGINAKEGPALDQLLQQSDQQVANSISNDLLPFGQYQNPFDAAGISFDMNSFGGPFIDTIPSDTAGDIPYVGSVDGSTDPFFATSSLGS